MHPDIEKALQVLTRHAQMAQAEKSFGHLLPKDEEDDHTRADLEGKIPGTEEVSKMETPHSDLDESAENVMLAHDANHTQEKVMDDFGNVPSDETSDTVDDDSNEAPPRSLGIMATIERASTKRFPMPPSPSTGGKSMGDRNEDAGKMMGSVHEDIGHGDAQANLANGHGIHETAKRRRGRPRKVRA